MKTKIQPLRTTVISALLGAAIGLPLTLTGCAMATCRPCAPRAGKRNPCNPCAARNPCVAMNPCAAGDRVNPQAITRPEGTKPYQGDRAALLNEGKALWNSKAISRDNSMSCSSCHQDGTAMLQPDFARPYPHFVQMAKDVADMESITLEEMIQLCMIRPMQSRPFAWDSRQLAALTAYTAVLQRAFKPVSNAVNPCAARNPCAPQNPCSMKNPCTARSIN